MPSRNEYIRWKARAAENFKRLRVKKYAQYRRFAVCRHRGRIGDMKAGLCMECRLKELRFDRAESQAEMAFNTEPIGAN